MADAIRVYLPWLLSAITIYMTVLAGNKSRNAWLFGLANQALWLVWIIATASWGLLPMNLALWVVYGRNHLKWNSGTRKQGSPVAPAKRVTPKDPQAVRPVEALRAGPDFCEGWDDPEERCPRHPRDCVCWRMQTHTPPTRAEGAE